MECLMLVESKVARGSQGQEAKEPRNCILSKVQLQYKYQKMYLENTLDK